MFKIQGKTLNGFKKPRPLQIVLMRNDVLFKILLPLQPQFTRALIKIKKMIDNSL